jgi:putative transposase
MDRWVSGSLCRKNMAQSPSNVALVHKTANILDKMPKSVQGKAKQLIHEMYLAPIGKEALAAFDQFLSSYQVKFPKACECLEKDKEVLFTFYDFLAQHWPHLRTTNPIESTFATVRLRTHRTKGCGSRIATLTMIFKLGLEAQSIDADSRASN